MVFAVSRSGFSGLRVKCWGFSRFRVSRFEVSCLRFPVSGFGVFAGVRIVFGVSGSWFRGLASQVRVSGSGFGVRGSGVAEFSCLL